MRQDICLRIILDVVANNYPDDTEEKFYMIANKDAVLPCGLTTSTHELPVMWFKDGLLVSTITSGKITSQLILNQRNAPCVQAWFILKTKSKKELII